MSFTEGKSTTCGHQHHLLVGLKDNPQSKQARTNPITNEEVSSSVVQSFKDISSENANEIPLLNLNYLNDDDFKTEPTEFGCPSNSPDSASTVSWGTSRTDTSVSRTQMDAKLSRLTIRPNGVPELELSSNRSNPWKQQEKLEHLSEKNKKLKLVEAVMTDQSSRALTKMTVTESLLSKQVQFDARIITRNGNDALRELTGFFFDFDNTLTVFEFKQFGKSSKVMPFIYRGQYLKMEGPNSGLPYTLLDIYTGSNLKIPTKDQLALADSLAENTYILLRITAVHENERQALLHNRVGRSGKDERMITSNRFEVDKQEYINTTKREVQKQIHKRAIQTVTGLGRYYRKLDHYNTGILDQYNLEKGLKIFHINLDVMRLEKMFEILDPEGSKMLDYKDYMCNIISEMSEPRRALVRKAFLKLDSSKKGSIHINDVRKFFNINARYKSSADGDIHSSALEAFLDTVRESEKQELISYLEFEEYYEGVSLRIDSDEEFAKVLHSCWNV